jgi:hypothetical protein
MKLLALMTYIFVFLSLSSCSSNHHLVFFTNTTIGVEIGSEPANGSPAKFLIGYKRQEGVIDPLIPDYQFVSNSGASVAPAGTLDSLTAPENGDTNIVLTPQGTALPEGASNRAHSVLAKMNFGATGGGNGASAAQFFATGRAADYLAQSNNIAGALAGDAKINENSKVNIDALGSANYAFIHDVDRLLNSYISNSGPNAGNALTIKNQVDKLDSDEFRQSFKVYSVIPGANNYDISDYPIPVSKEFRNSLSHIKAMSDSIAIAKQIVLDGAAKNNGTPITAQEKSDAVDNIGKYPILIEDAENKLSNSTAVISMINFVHENILLSKTSK